MEQRHLAAQRERATSCVLNVETCKAMRGELRGLRADVQRNSEQLRLQSDRMELVELTLRDAAEQIVMMGRGLRAAIEARARDDARLDDHERRLQRLEARHDPG